MTSFRITQQTILQSSLNNLNGNLSRTAKIQEQLSSGKVLNRPSDNPSGAVDSMTFRASQRRLEQYARNSQDALGWLGTADTTLTSSLTSIQRARSLALTGVNG